MKPWRRGILYGMVGGLVGIVGGLMSAGLVMGFGPIGALLILAVLLLVTGLYDLDQYYLKKGP